MNRRPRRGDPAAKKNSSPTGSRDRRLARSSRVPIDVRRVDGPSEHDAMSFIPAPLLSPRQSQFCEVLERLTRERGFAPSVRELASAMGVHASRVAQLAATTEAKGAIVREPRVSRSWRVVKPVASAKPASKRGR
jgi:hypothetical protein